MSTQTHRFNDVVVIGRAYHEAGLHCFYGEVVNEGARTTLNNPDACPEWERRLYDADGRSVPIEPGYGCAAVITPITLEAGEHLRFETLWNETRYDEPSRTFGPLDPGTYRWEIRFRPPEARTSFEYEVLVE